jgi:hypothetical protein
MSEHGFQLNRQTKGSAYKNLAFPLLLSLLSSTTDATREVTAPRLNPNAGISRS